MREGNIKSNINGPPTTERPDPPSSQIPPIDITGFRNSPSWNTGPSAAVLTFTRPRNTFFSIIAPNGDKLVDVNMETGDATIYGDVNEAARIFWKAVQGNKPNCKCGQ